MKTKKIIKRALKQPELYSEAELIYFELWKKAKKELKDAKRKARSDDNSV